jgi:methionyl-tRNA formyltransferase
MGRIRWHSAEHDSADLAAAALERRARAFDNAFGLYTFCSLRGQAPKRVRLLEVRAHEAQTDAQLSELYARHKPGDLVYIKPRKELFLRCGDGWLQINKLQIEGGREMEGPAFANGYLSSPITFCDVEEQQDKHALHLKNFLSFLRNFQINCGRSTIRIYACIDSIQH